MKKVLIVAMADSVHTAKWLRTFDGEAVDFVLFPSTPHRRVHKLILSHSQIQTSSKLQISKYMKYFALPLGVLDLFFDDFFRSKFLAKEIKRFKPDVIHMMETQHAGYLTDKALDDFKTKPKLILSIWGSDLFWFKNFPKHILRLRKLLPKIDVLVTECKRDEELARQLNFGGICINGVPASGGFDHSEFKTQFSLAPPSTRKSIAVKGYSGFVGLGPMAVRALEDVADVLSEYEVVIYSASQLTRIIAEYVKFKTKLNIKIFIKHSLTPDQMKELFLKSRIIVGVSKSDGLPATIKEAIFTGAFPIQTNTSCAGEWFENGVSIILVEPDSPMSLTNAIRFALQNDELVDTGAEINFEIAKNRMDSLVVREKTSKLYG